MKKPSIKDVATEAGVSVTTVSRCLNNRGYISEQTREKILQAMKKLRYYPNEVARSLFTNERNLIGVIFPTTNNPFFGELIFHIENELYKKGKKVLLCTSINEVELERDFLNMLRSKIVDGIIVGSHNELIADYQIPDLPIVAVDKEAGHDIPNVSCDNYAGGILAVEELIDAKCEFIIYISGAEEHAEVPNLREVAYSEKMESLGMEFILEKVPFSSSIEDKREKLHAIFEKYTEVDGVVAGDDMLAAAILNVVKARGKRVPEDIKLIGFDGAKTTLSMLPELSTIQQPISEIAKQSVTILMNEIESGKRIAQEVKLPVKLIRRETTRK
jgi:LacI family transcriptional regulator, sucrose operon repressor